MAETKVEVAYVTKYWGSRGIMKVTGCTTDEDGYLQRDLTHCSSPTYLFISKKDWFTDVEKAQDAVKVRAWKRVEALQKQVTKATLIAKNGVKVVSHDPQDT